ncbi:MAG: hypothetical protein II797_00280, partial [Clostridia bacterium]|nr:hypothetical protein [Clostridia bacterium]
MNDDILGKEISLLYPEGKNDPETGVPALSDYDAAQLEFPEMIDLKSIPLGSFMTSDPEVIRYRQETFRDLLENPQLVPMLKKMIPFLSDITELRALGSEDAHSSDSYLYSITEVELYASLLDHLKSGLLSIEDRLTSRAFTAFAERIRLLTQSEYYDTINRRLAELTRRVREIRSVTVGVNLDQRLRPEYAGLLAVNNEPFKSGEVLDKILRLDFKSDEMTAIAPLIPFRKEMTDNEKTAMSNALNGALGDVFKSSIRSWKHIIQTYVLENTDFLLRMLPEIEFLTKATDLLVRLKERGCPLCDPEIRPQEEKALTLEGLVNPVVALKVSDELVPNDIDFDENGKIYILTGPNRGGKSVLTTAVGHAVVFAQLGLPVPAEKAVLSPVDAVLTHFPTGSEDTIEKGRLGEECARIDAIFSRVTEDSLVLLDEALSSTGAFEASYIASEVLEGFSLARCRGIFSTHLHDLAAQKDRLNEYCLPRGGVAVDNLVAAMESGERSFKIRRAQPDGKSYARDIANRFGLSLPQILEKVRQNRKEN